MLSFSSFFYFFARSLLLLLCPSLLQALTSNFIHRLMSDDEDVLIFDDENSPTHAAEEEEEESWQVVGIVLLLHILDHFFALIVWNSSWDTTRAKQFAIDDSSDEEEEVAFQITYADPKKTSWLLDVDLEGCPLVLQNFRSRGSLELFYKGQSASTGFMVSDQKEKDYSSFFNSQCLKWKKIVGWNELVVPELAKADGVFAVKLQSSLIVESAPQQKRARVVISPSDVIVEAEAPEVIVEAPEPAGKESSLLFSDEVRKKASTYGNSIFASVDHSQIIEVFAAPDGNGVVLQCIACIGRSNNGNVSGRFAIKETAPTYSSWKRHVKDGSHQDYALLFIKNRGKSGADIVVRSTSGNADSRKSTIRSFLAVWKEAGGCERICNEVIYKSLMEEGFLFKICMDELPVTTKHRKAAVEKQRSHLLRVILSLAILGDGEHRIPEVAALTEYLQVLVPPVGVLNSKVKPMIFFKTPQQSDSQDDIRRFIAALASAFSVLRVRAVNRPPSILCFGNSERLRIPSVFEFSQQRKFTDYLLGLGVYHDEAADDAFSSVGGRAAVGQEYRAIASSTKNILYSLEILVKAGHLVASQGLGFDKGLVFDSSFRLQYAIEEWFRTERKVILVDIGSSIKAASSVRALHLEHHMLELMDFMICLKNQFRHCSDLLARFLHSIGKKLIFAEQYLRDQNPALLPGSKQLVDILVQQVLEPIFREPSVAECVRLGFVLSIYHLLFGSRPGWLLRIGSTIKVVENKESQTHKLRGTVSWDYKGEAVFVSSGDKTRHAYGSVGLDVPDTGQHILFLCELQLLVTLRIFAEKNVTPLWTPSASGNNSNRLFIPVLMQHLGHRNQQVVQAVPMLSKHKDLFDYLVRAIRCDFNSLSASILDMDSFIGSLIETKKPLESWTLAFDSAFAASKDRFVPKIIDNCGMLRIASSTVYTELANNRKDLLENIARVQQHSLSMQQQVYTPHSQMQHSLAASQSVLGLIGHSRMAFGRSEKKPEYLSRISKLQEIIPLVDPKITDLRVQMGVILGFPWVLSNIRPVFLSSVIDSLSYNLVSLVQEHVAGRGDFSPLILPNPGVWRGQARSSDNVIILPTLLLKHGLHLLCDECKGGLVLMRSPIRTSPVWADIRQNADECCKNLVKEQPGFFSVFDEEGIWICPNYFQVNANKRACSHFICAVLTSNETVVRVVTKDKAIEIWPFCVKFF